MTKFTFDDLQLGTILLYGRVTREIVIAIDPKARMFKTHCWPQQWETTEAFNKKGLNLMEIYIP